MRTLNPLHLALLAASRALAEEPTKCYAKEFTCNLSTEDHPDAPWTTSCCKKCKNDTESHKNEAGKECKPDRTVFSSEYWNVDLIAAFIWFIGAGLATSAGVGGGGIFVPLGFILLRLPVMAATGLSQASIFGASSAGLLINSRSSHPQANRPVIDLDMALFLAPMELAGAVLGVIIQSVLPTWLTMLLMFLILGATGVRTMLKGVDVLKKERKTNKEIANLKEKDAQDEEIPEKPKVEGPSPVNMELVEPSQANADPELAPETELRHSGRDVDEEEGTPGTSTTEESAPIVSPVSKHSGLKGDGDQEMADISEVKLEEDDNHDNLVKQAQRVKGPHHSAELWLEKDAARPDKKFFYLFIVWVVQVLFVFLKGGKKLKSVVGVEMCSPWYWVLVALSFVWLLSFSLLMGRRAVSKSVRKQLVKYQFVKGDVLWNWRKFRFFSFWTFVAGIIAGLIGIGGGMVLGPLMLQMGLLPQVSTATTATMIVITSSAVAIGYVTSGEVHWTFALTFFVIAFTGALVGKLAIDREVRKRGLTSILIFILGSIIIFAAIFALVNMFFDLEKHNWVFCGFKDACPKAVCGA